MSRGVVARSHRPRVPRARGGDRVPDNDAWDRLRELLTANRDFRECYAAPSNRPNTFAPIVTPRAGLSPFSHLPHASTLEPTARHSVACRQER
jgi:hypothetical protein